MWLGAPLGEFFGRRKKVRLEGCYWEASFSDTVKGSLQHLNQPHSAD